MAEPRRSDSTGFFSETVPGRRGEILDAALAVFDRKGFDAGTMREIAEEVGVSEPAIYRHFAGKEALFTEVVTLAAERFVTEARGMMSSLDPEDLRGSLGAIVEDRREALRRYLPLARVLIAVAVHRDEYREILGTKMAAPLAQNLLAVVPNVDAALGLSFTPEETLRRTRAYMALFVGWYATSILLRDDDPAPVVEGMLRVMSWE